MIRKGGGMLCLTRKKNEAIVVDGPCVVTVVEIRGDKVLLGIEASRETTIHHQEIYEQIYQKRAPWDVPPSPPPPQPA